ncbi:unnamed protein product [Orchesella dallaii]|uniref:Uncharacterized protein n=1 Tax=Orchesella dallaii TaxID=48710 RepID=A0ABP1QEL7_9HEXA
MANESAIELIYVSIFSCFIIDLPNDGSGQDCSQTNQSICIECATKMVRFFSRELITDKDGWGHSISFWIWLLIVGVGICGILMNGLIIFILNSRDKKNGPSMFDYLVTYLAVFDIFCSIASILAATSLIAIFGKYLTEKFS